MERVWMAASVLVTVGKTHVAQLWTKQVLPALFDRPAVFAREETFHDGRPVLEEPAAADEEGMFILAYPL